MGKRGKRGKEQDLEGEGDLSSSIDSPFLFSGFLVLANDDRNDLFLLSHRVCCQRHEWCLGMVRAHFPAFAHKALRFLTF